MCFVADTLEKMESGQGRQKTEDVLMDGCANRSLEEMANLEEDSPSLQHPHQTSPQDPITTTAPSPTDSWITNKKSDSSRSDAADSQRA